MSNESLTNTGASADILSVTSQQSRQQPVASGSDITKEPTDSSDANSSLSQGVEIQDDVDESSAEEPVSPPPPRKKASKIFPKPQAPPDAPSIKAQAPTSLSSVGSTRRHSRTDTFGKIIPPDNVLQDSTMGAIDEK